MDRSNLVLWLVEHFEPIRDTNKSTVAAMEIEKKEERLMQTICIPQGKISE